MANTTMMEYLPMAGVATVPVTDYSENLKELRRWSAATTRRRNERLTRGYASAELLHCVAEEQKRLLGCS